MKNLEIFGKHRKSLCNCVQAIVAVLQGFEVCLELVLEDWISLPLLSVRLIPPELSLTA